LGRHYLKKWLNFRPAPTAIVIKRKDPPHRRNKHLCADAGYRGAEHLRTIEGGADKKLDWFYAASPRLTRYSIGLREPREILIRFSLYQRM